MTIFVYLWQYLAEFFLKREVFQEKKGVVENIKMHIQCSNFFPPENRAVYEIMWKNTVEPDRPQMTIWRRRTACWVIMDIDIHWEYVVILLFHCNNGWRAAPRCHVTRTSHAFWNVASVRFRQSSSSATHSAMTSRVCPWILFIYICQGPLGGGSPRHIASTTQQN